MFAKKNWEGSTTVFKIIRLTGWLKKLVWAVARSSDWTPCNIKHGVKFYVYTLVLIYFDNRITNVVKNAKIFKQ